VFMIFAEQFAFSSPTELEIESSLGSHPRREHVASVMPQPCYTSINLKVSREWSKRVAIPSISGHSLAIALPLLR